MATGRRTYDDPCGVARGLNLVGERWALLVVRELLHGPKRFTDLHHNLPTASQNVLSQRLRELEQSGIVRRRRLGPPASSWVYELTEWGYDLEPVLFQLSRWGSRAPMTSDAELSVDALLLALKTTFNPLAAGEPRVSYELRLGEDRVQVQIADRRIELTRGAAAQPDAVVETDVATLRGLVFGGRRLDDALSSGDLMLKGDRRVVEHFVELFPRPVQAQTSATKTPRAAAPVTSAPRSERPRGLH
jgi:DNA-binding HxlR family transcriptional regulator